jgi:hypothetical protein
MSKDKQSCCSQVTCGCTCRYRLWQATACKHCPGAAQGFPIQKHSGNPYASIISLSMLVCLLRVCHSLFKAQLLPILSALHSLFDEATQLQATTLEQKG